MDDGLEAALQVHAFGQAVGGDEHRAPGFVFGELPDPRFALVGRQHAGDRGDLVVVAEAARQVLGDVLGGVDETAEHDRVVAVQQKPGDHLGEQGELGVAGAFQLGRPVGKPPEPPAMRGLPRRYLAVGARRCVGGLDGFLVGQVEYCRAAEPVGFRHVFSVQVGGARA